MDTGWQAHRLRIVPGIREAGRVHAFLETRRWNGRRSGPDPEQRHAPARIMASYPECARVCRRRGATGTDVMLLPIEGDEARGWKPGQESAFLNTVARESG